MLKNMIGVETEFFMFNSKNEIIIPPSSWDRDDLVILGEIRGNPGKDVAETYSNYVKKSVDIHKNVQKNKKTNMTYSFKDKNKIKNKIKNVSTLLKKISKNKFKDFDTIEVLNMEFEELEDIFNLIPGVNEIEFDRDNTLDADDVMKLSLSTRELITVIDEQSLREKQLEAKIKKLELEKNIIFAGILKGKEKLQTINSCDLFLLTSRSEGLPMTVLEVAALGIPQVLSKNCNVPEIEEFNAGKVFNLNQKKEMANSIINILNNQDEIKRMSASAKKLSQEKFNLSKVCNKFEKIYRS